MKSTHLRCGRSGFSLLEIFAVLAIIALLMALTVPAVEQMLAGSRISIAGNVVIDELNLARQTALSKNMPVEVRLYRLPESQANPVKYYRAMQIFISSAASQLPVGKIVFLPQGVVIDEKTSVSSIFTQSGGPLSNPKVRSGTFSIPQYGTNYEYISFRFKGNGETDMHEKPAFFTLIALKDIKSANGLPTNFVTIQVDPVNGRSRAFRP